MKKRSIKNSFKSAIKSFISMMPMIVAVILLVGIMKTFITKEVLLPFFTKNSFIDIFIGTFAGGVAVGNPIVSYIIGKELLDIKVSLYAVTAFMLSWVTLGVVQLPLEMEVLGVKFTIYRNILAAISTLIVSIATVFTLEVLK